ncbi:excinuclease ABC subunit UvrC [bacterium]|nr:excinuclease ABC subunit UvrC [bacterium]
MNQVLKKRLKNLKDIPGVYLMKDQQGEIIYVGKASSLKSRVSSYFYGKKADSKTFILSLNIKDFEVIPVASEAEALILENQLIKKYQPKYNVDLKDGKSYPLVKLSAGDYPSISVVREIERDDKSVYYGPFTDAKLLREIVRFIRIYYPIRNCNKDIEKSSSKVCTQYHIKKCSGPCERKISKDEYSWLILGIKAFFEGDYKNFENLLKKWLDDAVGRLDFEEANEIKKRLFLLDRMKSKFPLRSEKELLSYGETNVLEKLTKTLNLKKIPYIIEGFDVSNITGTFATAAKVVFKGGFSDKSGYRKYKLCFNKNIDDYRMIEEVLERRFLSEKDIQVPDLILIDGGKGHLNVATQVLRKLKLEIPIISLAEENENIYTQLNKEPIILPDDSPERHLLERVRNEAHRFALSYHRRLRVKNVKVFFLDDISGIGETRKERIKQAFPDITSLVKTDLDKLKEIGIPSIAAEEIIRRAKKFWG